MSKEGALIGGGIGGIFGLLVGLILPDGSDLALQYASSISRQPTTIESLQGTIISGVIVLISVAICGAIGSLIGSLFGESGQF